MFKGVIAGFIYLVANTGIVLNSILTASEFWNVPNSNIYFGNAIISEMSLIPTKQKFCSVKDVKGEVN